MMDVKFTEYLGSHEEAGFGALGDWPLQNVVCMVEVKGGGVTDFTPVYYMRYTQGRDGFRIALNPMSRGIPYPNVTMAAAILKEFAGREGVKVEGTDPLVTESFPSEGYVLPYIYPKTIKKHVHITPLSKDGDGHFKVLIDYDNKRIGAVDMFEDDRGVWIESIPYDNVLKSYISICGLVMYEDWFDRELFIPRHGMSEMEAVGFGFDYMYDDWFSATRGRCS